MATYTVSDPEGDDITLTAEGVDGARFRFSGTELHFNALPDYETPLDDGGDGTYNLTVVVADDKNSTSSIAVTVTVTNINEEPRPSAFEDFTRSVTENTAPGQNVGAPFRLTDPEAKELTYHLAEGMLRTSTSKS